MSVINALAARFTWAISGRREAVVVRIEDEIAGAPMGWGPEVDEFAEDLARITRALGGDFTSRTRTASSYQWTLHVAQPARWLEEVESLLGASAVGVAVSLFTADRAGSWQPLRRRGKGP